MVLSAKKGSPKGSDSLDIELLMLPPAAGYVDDVTERAKMSKTQEDGDAYGRTTV